MISPQRIKHLKAKREYFERRDDEHRLRQLDSEERDAWKDDLTQPSDSRFKTLYPKQHAELEKGREGQEQSEIADKKNREGLLHRFRHNPSEKQALTKLFNKEDRQKYG